MPSNVPVQSLTDRLTSDLVATFDPRATMPIIGGEAMVRVFERFGSSARAGGLTLSDTIAAASLALESLIDNFLAETPGIDRHHSLGIALAAAVRQYTDVENGQPDAGKPQHFPDTRQDRLEALHRINRAATSNLQSDEMLDTVVNVVRLTTHSDASAIFLYNDSTGLLHLAATRGLNPDAVNTMTLRLGDGIVGRAAIEGTVIAAPNARQHESFLAHPVIGDENYASQVSVPILLQGHNRLVGVLNIHSIEPRTYDDDELEFLRTVAGELAISIENARQYVITDEQLHQKIEQLGTLQRVSRILASTLDIRSVLRMITVNAMEISGAEAAAIFRPNRTSTSGQLVPIIESRTGSIRVLKDVRDRDMVVADVFDNGVATTTLIEYEDGMANLHCAPLRSAREIVGAICYRTPEGVTFSSDMMNLLQAFADSAAMAIENAELYEDARRGLLTQRTLVQEMHHRVRNNLQTVAALLSLQLRRAEGEPWGVEIREAVSRIQAIAAVHDLLSDPKRFAGTTVDMIARLVAEDAHSTLIPPTLRVTFDIHPSDLRIPSRQATIMSLLINELAANAISHGFENRDKGYIRIRAWNDDGVANVEIFNDGARVPDGFDPAQSQGLGMKITHRLVTSDLHGDFQISSDADGTTALITFPIATEAEEDVAVQA